jgi:ketosteroid isomerase-like protein
MSQENVEVVRRIFEAFNSREWAAWESHHHPDFEWSDPPEMPGGGFHRGVGSIRRFLDDVLETADEWHVEIDDIKSVGDDRVLMLGRSILVGRASGIAMEDPLFQLFDLEQGRVTRVQTFRSSDEALEAVGLSEQDAHADS